MGVEVTRYRPLAWPSGSHEFTQMEYSFLRKHKMIYCSDANSEGEKYGSHYQNIQAIRLHETGKQTRKIFLYFFFQTGEKGT